MVLTDVIFAFFYVFTFYFRFFSLFASHFTDLEHDLTMKRKVDYLENLVVWPTKTPLSETFVKISSQKKVSLNGVWLYVVKEKTLNLNTNRKTK